MSATLRGEGPALAAARRHPRHLVLALVAAGLALGGRAPASVLALAALLVAFVALPIVRRPLPALAGVAVLLGAAVAGQARTHALDATRLPIGERVTETATVLAPPRMDAYGGRRALARVRGEPVLLRIPAWLAAQETDPITAPVPRVGDFLAVQGTLRPPDLAARAVHAHATLRATAVTPTGRRRGGALGTVDTIRRRAQATLAGAHLPPAEAALLEGMVLGDDSTLPDDVADAFTAVGLSHLTAASGQNVALLAALVLALGVATGAGVRARWLATLALIAIYVPLAGGGASIQRAGITGAATIAAALAGRPASSWHALLLAAVATLALDPRAVGDAGWQLSFAAVVGIALLAAPIRARLVARRVPDPLAEAAAVTLAATVATGPLVALHFDRVTLATIPANLLAAPAVAPIMWLGFAAAALGQVAPATALVTFTGPPLAFLVGLARTFAAPRDPTDGPLAALAATATAPLPLAAVLALCAVAAIAVLLAHRRHAADPHPHAHRLRRRQLAAAPLLALALLGMLAFSVHRARPLAPPPSGTLRVTALDVGQGDATLLQTTGHAVLVDAGPPGTDVVAQLRHAGVRRLDALVLTHPQLDHDGNAPAVLSALPTTLLLDGRDGDRSATSRAVDAPAVTAHARIVPAAAGQTVHAGPITLSVLWPPPQEATVTAPGAAVPSGDPNDRAIVALATAYDRSVLLTADAESPVLSPLDLPPVDVLKVSHHGSADPGLPQLLDHLRPRLALIEVGAHNTYGHPSPSTLTALQAAGVPIKRTDRDGAVRVDLDRRPAHLD